MHAVVQHLPPPERPRQRLDHCVVDPRPRRPLRPVGRHHQLPSATLPDWSWMWTVMVCPSAEAVPFTPLPSCSRPSRTSPATCSGAPDLDAMHPHVHPLHQQLRDPRLLGREQPVPQRVMRQHRLPRLLLGYVVLLGARRPPGADDDPRLPEDAPQLVDGRRLDLGRRHAPDRARVGPRFSTSWLSSSGRAGCPSGCLWVRRLCGLPKQPAPSIGLFAG